MSGGDGREPRRVVLDTNVLLSLWVFRDSRFAPLRAELAGGRWRALTDEACRGEFRHVLRYPLFALDAQRQEAILADYMGLAEQVNDRPAPAAALPACRDPEDQKFLELARDGRAEWLVTSDKALLKLARRRRLDGLFRILRPEEALAAIGDPDAPDPPPRRS